MTHPFHPLFGKVLDVVDRRCCQSGERLYLELGPGRAESLPVEWTSLGVVDPFVTIAAGRSLFRVDRLLRLAELVSELRARLQTEPPCAAVKGNTPNAER